MRKWGHVTTNPEAGPLFADQAAEDDLASGTIYVLRSKSEHPLVASNRDVLHKIGVTGGKVETRIANASLEPTFLMAEVEVIASYPLYKLSAVGQFSGTHAGNIGSPKYTLALFTYTFGFRYLLPIKSKHFNLFAQGLIGGSHASGSLVGAPNPGQRTPDCRSLEALVEVWM